MTLSQSINSCIPPSSSSSDSELNNALPVLLNNKNDSQENAVESACYIFDPLFPLIPLPQTTDLLRPQAQSSTLLLSQEVPQSTSMRSVDTLQPPTSIVHGMVLNSMPIADSSTTLSLSNSCILPSSASSSDPEMNDVLHAFLDRNHGQESIQRYLIVWTPTFWTFSFRFL